MYIVEICFGYIESIVSSEMKILHILNKTKKKISTIDLILFYIHNSRYDYFITECVHLMNLEYVVSKIK